MNMWFQSRIRPAASGHLAQGIDAQLGGEALQNRKLDLGDFKNFFHGCCPLTTVTTPVSRTCHCIGT